MIVAWVLGLWLAWKAGYCKDAWFHGMAAAAIAGVLLGGARLSVSMAVRAFAEDRNDRPARF